MILVYSLLNQDNGRTSIHTTRDEQRANNIKSTNENGAGLRSTTTGSSGNHRQHQSVTALRGGGRRDTDPRRPPKVPGRRRSSPVEHIQREESLEGRIRPRYEGDARACRQETYRVPGGRSHPARECRSLSSRKTPLASTAMPLTQSEPERLRPRSSPVFRAASTIGPEVASAERNGSTFRNDPSAHQ